MSEDSAAANGRPQATPLWKVMVLAVSAMQIGPNLALTAGFQIPYSGTHSWLAFLGAALLSMLVALVIAKFAGQYGGTVSILTYAQRSLPEWAISVTAATVLIGYIVGPALSVLASVIYLGSIANSLGIMRDHVLLLHCLIGIAVAILIGICASKGLDLSAKLSMMLGAVCLPLAVGITLSAGQVFGFDVLPQLDLHMASLESLPRGIFVAAAFFIGFDCVAALANDTKNPQRAAPLVLTWSVALVGVTFVLGVLMQTPVLLSHSAELDAGDSPSKVLMEAAQLRKFSLISDIIFVTTGIAGLIAWLNGAAIVVATAAADGFLPKRLRLHENNESSPLRAVWLLTAVSVVVPPIILVSASASPLASTLYVSNFFVLLWLVPYGLICAAMAFGSHGQKLPLRVVAAAGVGAISTVVYAQLAWPLDQIALVVNLTGILLIAVTSGVFFILRRRLPRLQIKVG